MNARRGKPNEGPMGPALGLVILLAFAGATLGSSRPPLSGLGTLLAWALGIAILLVLVITLIKRWGFVSNVGGPEIYISDSWSTQPFIRRAKDLAEQLRAIDRVQFDKLMEIAYRNLDYKVNRGIRANDGEIDLVLEKGEERVAVQCKNWKNRNVGVAKVRELLGSMAAARISRGILVTGPGSSDEAKTFAESNNIQLLDEAQVVLLLESVDAWSHPEFQIHLNDARGFDPKCEEEMVH